MLRAVLLLLLAAASSSLPLDTLASCRNAIAAAGASVAAAPWVGGTFATLSDFTAAAPAVLSIVNPSWQGVRSAAYALGAPVAEAYIDSADALLRWLRLVRDSAPFLRHIIVHGIPSGSVELAAWLACPDVRAPGAPLLKLHFTWHGSPRWVAGGARAGRWRGGCGCGGNVGGVGVVSVSVGRVGARTHPLPAPTPTSGTHHPLQQRLARRRGG